MKQVLITAEAETQLIKEWNNFSSSRLEFGGVMLGRTVNGYYVIDVCSGGGPKAEASGGHFTPDIDYINQTIATGEQAGHYYLGHWHFHPNYLDHPSMGDTYTVKELFDDLPHIDTIVMIIMTKNPKSQSQAIQVHNRPFTLKIYLYHRQQFVEDQTMAPHQIPFVYERKISGQNTQVNLDTSESRSAEPQPTEVQEPNNNTHPAFPWYFTAWGKKHLAFIKQTASSIFTDISFGIGASTKLLSLTMQHDPQQQYKTELVFPRDYPQSNPKLQIKNRQTNEIIIDKVERNEITNPRLLSVYDQIVLGNPKQDTSPKLKTKFGSKYTSCTEKTGLHSKIVVQTNLEKVKQQPDEIYYILGEKKQDSWQCGLQEEQTYSITGLQSVNDRLHSAVNLAKLKTIDLHYIALHKPPQTIGLLLPNALATQFQLKNNCLVSVTHLNLFGRWNESTTTKDPITWFVFSNFHNSLVTIKHEDVTYVAVSHPAVIERINAVTNVEKLAACKAVVLGLGTGGAFVAHQLARAGVGHLLLFDMDRLAVENIIRHESGKDDIGRLKVNAVAESIKKHNPSVKTTKLTLDFLEDEVTFKRIISGADILIEATGRQSCASKLNQLAIELDIPCILAGAYAKASSGYVQRIIPQEDTPCYECLLDFTHGSGPKHELTEEERAMYRTVTDLDELISEPGLYIDVVFIANLQAKLAVLTLLRQIGKPNSDDPGFHYYLWNSKRNTDLAGHTHPPLTLKPIKAKPFDHCPVCHPQLFYAKHNLDEEDFDLTSFLNHLDKHTTQQKSHINSNKKVRHPPKPNQNHEQPVVEEKT